ncbi:MAG: dolichol kinase [Sulfolobales archaeon]|nr:dolichol kinase [Acidilobaceae archaeon]MDW7974152.1 dolichol kinase [Sulfolobales archaeon]
MLVMPLDPWREAAITAALAVYVLAVIFATSLLYSLMRNRGISEESARYYNRKIIHALGGGVVALLVPVLYSSPLFLLLATTLLGTFLLLARRYRIMKWFQTEDNAYEVNFVLAWGLSVFLLWNLLKDPMVAVVPALFISFGDAATGFVRNFLFSRRTKHWIGNVAMGLVCVPMGFLFAGTAGAAAGLLASIVERFEFGYIDDNVLITLVTTLVIIFFESV